jgi:hypothetical protein
MRRFIRLLRWALVILVVLFVLTAITLRLT